MARMDRDRYKEVINDYIDGKVKLRGEHPKDVMEAIDSFFMAGKMMVDYPEMDTVPGEYVDKLIKTMAKHPEYHGLVMDLIGILKRHEKM
jgi:hypothetical protein